MAVYLAKHPPARQQFYTSRRNPVTAIVLHTAQNTTDLVLPDAGAEAVAGFISRRSDAGSYASMVDSDSIVRVGEYWWTMFHAAGFNSKSLGLSWACKAAQWPTLPERWVKGAIEQGAIEAARMSVWTHGTYGWHIPARRVDGRQAHAGARGFVTHQDLEDLRNPGRRTDPGRHFPWLMFLDRYRTHHRAMTGYDPGGVAPMPKSDPDVVKIQKAVLSVDPDALPKFGADGRLGDETTSAVVELAVQYRKVVEWGKKVNGELTEARESNTKLQQLLAQAQRDGKAGRLFRDAIAALERG